MPGKVWDSTVSWNSNQLTLGTICENGAIVQGNTAKQLHTFLMKILILKLFKAACIRVSVQGRFPYEMSTSKAFGGKVSLTFSVGEFCNSTPFDVNS